MDIWSILGIRQTGEKEEIQRAYRSRLAHTNPEDDPEGFMELRQAFEEAVRAADERKEGMQEKPQWAEGPVGAWIEKVDAVYSRFSRRIDTGEWERLLQEEVCQNLDTCIAARDALLDVYKRQVVSNISRGAVKKINKNLFKILIHSV